MMTKPSTVLHGAAPINGKIDTKAVCACIREINARPPKDEKELAVILQLHGFAFADWVAHYNPQTLEYELTDKPVIREVRA